MALTWTDDLRVGIIDVDKDHRHLCAIVDEVEAASADGAIDDVQLGKILIKLRDYARSHFAREELLQEEVGYDGLRENREQHRTLILDLNEFIASYLSGNLGDRVETTGRIRNFLRGWLVGHILKVDRSMRGRILPWAG
jgi:hemerythrin